MGLYYTEYCIARNAIEALDYKYLEKLDLSNSKLFLYANTYEMPKFYRLLKKHRTSYDLYEKITNYRQDLLIKSLIDEVKRSKYYAPYILMLYSISSSLILHEEMKKTNILPYQYSQYDCYAMKKENIEDLYKSFKNSFIYSFTELDLLKDSLKSTYHMPLTDKYMLESIKVFKRCLNPNPLFRAFAFIVDLLFFRKTNISYKNCILKKTFKNFTPDFKYNENSISFDEFINKISAKVTLFLDAINQALYFDKEAPLVEFVQEYNWDSIADYYDFLAAEKEKAKLRNRRYSLLSKEKRKLRKMERKKKD